MINTVKAIILDVDGVIVGEKIGFNSPNPNIKVIKKLKEIQDSGIPIILCTAKPHFAIGKIIRDANLNNFHITDGGGIVIDPLSNKILMQHIIPKVTVTNIVTTLLKANIYTELYSIDSYYIDSTQVGIITKQHERVIQSPPKVIMSLVKSLSNLEITKIMPIANNLDDKERVNKILQQFIPEVVVSWGVHPVILPLQFGIVTAPGISKSIAASLILNQIGVRPQDTLGVGDSNSDWQFIESCGYGVAMGNATDELKQLVLSKGAEYSYIAPSVDENGILSALEHFNLSNC